MTERELRELADCYPGGTYPQLHSLIAEVRNLRNTLSRVRVHFEAWTPDQVRAEIARALGKPSDPPQDVPF